MEMPVEWQTVVMVPIFTKEDRRVCSNYPDITLLSLPGRVYVRVLENVAGEKDVWTISLRLLPQRPMISSRKWMDQWSFILC